MMERLKGTGMATSSRHQPKKPDATAHLSGGRRLLDWPSLKVSHVEMLSLATSQLLVLSAAYSCLPIEAHAVAAATLLSTNKAEQGL